MGKNGLRATPYTAAWCPAQAVLAAGSQIREAESPALAQHLGKNGMRATPYTATWCPAPGVQQGEGNGNGKGKCKGKSEGEGK